MSSQTLLTTVSKDHFGCHANNFLKTTVILTKALGQEKVPGHKESIDME